MLNPDWLRMSSFDGRLIQKRTHPGGKYRLHLGTLEDLTLIRYDTAHKDTKGHELHTAAGDTDVEFPGMEALLTGFWASTDEYWDAVEGGPIRPY